MGRVFSAVGAGRVVEVGFGEGVGIVWVGAAGEHADRRMERTRRNARNLDIRLLRMGWRKDYISCSIFFYIECIDYFKDEEAGQEGPQKRMKDERGE